MTHEVSDHDEPQVPKAQQAAVIAASSTAALFKDLPPNVEVNVDRLFDSGRQVTDSYGGTALTTRRSLGHLNLTSGVIGVRDFALDAWRIAPLERRVNPGRYEVEVGEVFDRVTAIRVTFQPGVDVAAWKAAATIRGKHYSPVDLGTAAVFDMAAFINMTRSHKQQLFLDHNLGAASRPSACLVSMQDEHDGLVVASGSGDAGYPSYWGIDAAGQVVSLVVDFLVLAKFKNRTISEPWTLDLLGSEIISPTLATEGLSVKVTHSDIDQIVVAVSGSEQLVKVRLVDSSGAEPFIRNGVVRSGSTRHHTFTGHLLDLATIELAVPAGYSN